MIKLWKIAKEQERTILSILVLTFLCMHIHWTPGCFHLTFPWLLLTITIPLPRRRYMNRGQRSHILSIHMYAAPLPFNPSPSAERERVTHSLSWLSQISCLLSVGAVFAVVVFPSRWIIYFLIYITLWTVRVVSTISLLSQQEVRRREAWCKVQVTAHTLRSQVAVTHEWEITTRTRDMTPLWGNCIIITLINFRT